MHHAIHVRDASAFHQMIVSLHSHMISLHMYHIRSHLSTHFSLSTVYLAACLQSVCLPDRLFVPFLSTCPGMYSLDEAML